MKAYIIEATVNLSIYGNPASKAYDPEYAHKAIADMLRYDNGKVLAENTANGKTTFRIRCINYTERRWLSFGIKTTLMSLMGRE